MQPLLGQRRHLGERDGERVEGQRQRLGVEVAARVEPLRLIALGLEIERAVGHGAQLALELRQQVVELVVCGAVHLGKHAQGNRRLRALLRPRNVRQLGQASVHVLLAGIALQAPDP